MMVIQLLNFYLKGEREKKCHVKTRVRQSVAEPTEKLSPALGEVKVFRTSGRFS